MAGFFCSACFAGSPAGLIKEGNRLYNQKKYKEAIEKYSQAQKKAPDSDIISFNKGTALYKKGEYKKAIEEFTKVLTTKDPSLEAKTNYNIGNCKYRLGEESSKTDINTAVSLLKDSLDYYKRAIELDQKDSDSKYNYEFAKKRLDMLLKKQKTSKSKTDREKHTKKKQKASQRPSKGSSEAQRQEAKKKTQQKEQRKKGKSKIPQPDKEKKEMAKQHSLGEGRGRHMSEQEARMLLNNILEKGGRIIESDKRHISQQEVYKDW